MKNFSTPYVTCRLAHPMGKTAEGVKVQHIILYVDISGSMSGTIRKVYEAVIELLKDLAKKGENMIDITFEVTVYTFSEDVKKINDTPLAPEQLLEVLTEDKFAIESSTNIGKVIAEIDKNFHKPQAEQIVKNGCPTLVIMISDFCATDHKTDREKYLKTLRNNTYFMNLANCLCILVDSNVNTEEAKMIAGSEENVIHLSANDIKRYLGAILKRGSSILIERTYTTETETESSAETASRVKREDEDGFQDSSAAKLSGDQIKNTMINLIKKRKQAQQNTQ